MRRTIVIILSIVSLLLLVGTSFFWLSISGGLPLQTETVEVNAVKQWNSIVSLVRRIRTPMAERRLGEYLQPTAMLPTYEYLPDASGGARYQVYGTVEGLVGNLLLIRARDVEAVRVNERTIFACTEYVGGSMQIRDYSKRFIDYARYLTTDADETFIRRAFGLPTFSQREISRRIVAHSWVYIFVPRQSWEQWKTASHIFLTYCYP